MAGAGSRFPATYNRLAKWYPHISVQFPVAPQELTRDREEQERYLADGLIHDSVSLQCYDPICSYQATALLSSKLLKRNPGNFIFKSWKGNRHDPHWDIDALSVRSEFTHWILAHCKHFVSLPLEPGMVRYDSLKSIRSNKSADAQSKNKGTKKKDKQSKSKGKDKGKNLATVTTPSSPTGQDQSEAISSPTAKSAATEEPEAIQTSQDQSEAISSTTSKSAATEEPEAIQTSQDQSEAISSTTAKSAATEEPEAIQDLEGLRRQQVLRMQKAEEKRRLYSQGSLESPTEANTSTANMQQPPPPQPIENGVGTTKDSLDPKIIPNPSLGVSLDELTLRLEKEAEAGVPIPRAISLDQMPQPIGMALSTISLPLTLGNIDPDALTPNSALPKVEDKEINECRRSTQAPPQASIPDTAKAVDEPVALPSIESPAMREVDVAPTVEPTEQHAVLVEVAKDASPVPETTLFSARTPLEEVEEAVPAMASTPHLGHPPPEQSMITV
ncbi:hypothetical protein BGZ82_000691 [Podila clonocystis]|nr:hypothetical protein BGZ82_000691 [Podila clonocystis]